MRVYIALLALLTCCAVVQTQTSVTLTGTVSSAEEGPMEGVLVSAKRAGSTVTTTVVSDREGRYRFPQTRLQPGDYTLRIRAVGYELETAGKVALSARRTTTQDLKLTKTRDLASQLTNAEWLASFPGSDDQRTSIRGCAHCNTLELVTR